MSIVMRERKRNRLVGYDYSQDNLYFVTSCVQDRICCFGEIQDGKMILNEYGQIAQNQWGWLGNQYSYLVLHAFVVMLNHIHGIIEINRDGYSGKIKSLSELMGVYKTTTSKQIHLNGLKSFAWQRSFHDHIIRNEQAFEKISNYIENNPLKWKDDTFY